MKVRLQGLFLALGLLWILLAVVTWQWPDHDVHLVFCDVGQGDGILIWQGFSQMVVDAGKDEAMLSCLDRHLPWWDKRLELIVATHADSDHIGGFDEILSNFDVQHVLVTTQAKNSSDFEVFAAAIKEKVRKGAELSVASVGQQLNVAPILTGSVLWPLRSPDEGKMKEYLSTETELLDMFDEKTGVEDDWNGGSIVLLMQLGTMRVLLTGDAETVTESALLKQGMTKDIDVLKVGHHGSKNSTSPSFIAGFQPEKAVISSGKNNQYGHPSEEVMRRLVESGIAILRTDHEGDIHVISNSTRFWLK